MAESRRGEAGQVLPMLVLFILAMAFFLALLTTMGTAYVYREVLQQAADAAALAAARQTTPVLDYLYPDPANPGSCSLSDPADPGDPPCGVENAYLVFNANAESEARRIAGFVAAQNEFADRGITFDPNSSDVRVFLTVLGTTAQARVIVEARVRLPLLGMSGASEIRLSREATSAIQMDCGGAFPGC